MAGFAFREKRPTSSVLCRGPETATDQPRGVLERAVTLCRGSEVTPAHFDLDTLRQDQPEALDDVPYPASGTRAEQIREAQRIAQALDEHEGNISRAAQHVAMPRRTFVAKMDMYQIAHPKAER
jgi:DNA-binding NtrC family response regulator